MTSDAPEQDLLNTSSTVTASTCLSLVSFLGDRCRQANENHSKDDSPSRLDRGDTRKLQGRHKKRINTFLLLVFSRSTKVSPGLS